MKTELVIFDTIENSKKGVMKGVVAMLTLICIDMIWFRLSKKTYQKEVPNIMNTIRYPGALISWFLVACALSVHNPKSLKEAIAYGSLVGFVIYGVYNFTNYAVLKNWTLNISIVDTIWGVIVCSITSIVLFKIFSKYK
jgi:uncharacterized membrane protein